MKGYGDIDMALNGNDLGIFLKAILEPSSLKYIKTEINNLQNLFDKSPIKIKLDVDNNEFKAFQANIEKLSKNITTPVDFKTDLTGIDSFVVKLKQVTGEQAKQTEIITKGKNELNQEVSILNKLDNEGKNVASTFVTITDNTKKTTKELETQLSLYKQKMVGLDGTKGELDIFSQKYKGKFDSTELESLKKRINDLNVSTPELNTKMKQLGIEFSSMRQQASQSASVLTRTLEGFTKFARFYIVGGFLVGAVNNLKDAMTTLKEIDSQMVEIAKVTNLSADAMTKLKDSSFDTASDFGRKAQDYLSAVTEFSRAGYELQSSELSKVSLLAQNVGELTSEQANEFLIATDAAYKYKGSQEELTRVLDGVNQIDNKFATSIQKVSEGITRAGSIASNAKIGVNELSAALGTMTAVTQRSGSEMGNAFKGIVMNLMQVKGSTEEGDIIDDEALSKSAKALDSVNIKTTELVNGIQQLRNPMKIIEDISAKWNTLSNIDQSKLIDAIGGKYRGNAFSSLVTNFDMYQKMLTEYANSAGSAMKENEVRMSSWETKANQLSNAMSKFWNNTIDTGAIKSSLDVLIGLINVLDSNFVRTVGTIALVSASIYGLGVGFQAFTKTTLATRIGVLALDIAEKGLLTTSKALWATLSASPLFWVIAATTTVVGLVKAIDALNISVEEQKEKVEQAKQFFESTKSEIESLNKELETTNNRINELNSKSKLEITEKDELSKLQLTNEELKLRLALLQKEEEIKQAKLAKEQETLYNKQFGDYNFSESQVSTYQSNANLTGNNAGLMAEKNNVSAMIAAYKQFSELKKQALDSGDLSNVEHFDGLLTNIKESLINSAKDLQKTKDTLSSLKNPSEAQKKIIDNIVVALSLINGIVIPDKLENTAEGAVNANNALKSVLKTAEEYKKEFEELNNSYSAQTKKVQELVAYREELNSKEGLSAKSMNEIIEKHQELIPYLNDETKLRTKLTEVINQEEQAQITAYVKMMEASETFFNSQILGNTQLVNELNKKYGIDLKNYKSLAEAKDAIEQTLIASLATKWGAFYDAQNQTFTDTFYKLQSAMPSAAAEIQKNMQPDLDKFKEVENRFKGIVLKLAPVNFNKINLGDIKTDGSKGKNNQELQEPEKLIEKDRYYQLNQELNKTEALLNKINLQEERAGRQEKIKLLDQEVKLLQRKQNNIHAIAEEERKERSELVKSLKSQGMKFSGTGDDITAANGQAILDRKLDAVNAHRNDKDRSTYNKLKAQFDDLKKSYDRFIELQITDIPKAQEQWGELAVDIEKVKVDKISLSFEIFNDTLEPANRQLKELEHIYNLLGENDVAEKEKNINAQMKIKAEMLNSINGKILEYQKLINSTKSNAEKEIYQNQIDSLKDQSYQLSEAITEATQKSNDDKLSLYNDSISKIKDLLKKQYDLDKELLDESLDNYKDYINGIIEERDRLNDSEDYQESINESNTKINEIQAEIDKRKMAAMQGDLVAINEIAELQKQKADEEKNLKDKQKDWERKQTKQNLQDNLKYYEDYTNGQKKLLDEKTSDTALQLEAERILAQNSITAVQDTINQLFNKTGENATKAGQLVQSELIAKLQQVMEIQKNLDSITALSSQSSSSNTNSNSSLSYVDRVKSQMRQNSDAYGTASPEQKKMLADKNLELGTSIGWHRDTHGVWYDQNGNLAQYATGGVDDKGGLSVLHGTPSAVETIFNAEQGKKLFNFVDNLPFSANNILPNISLPQITPIASGAGSITVGDINIHGVSKIDESVLPNLTDRIMRELSKKQKLEFNRGGIYRSY